jgi:hypothetical protein
LPPGCYVAYKTGPACVWSERFSFDIPGVDAAMKLNKADIQIHFGVIDTTEVVGKAKQQKT